MKHVLKDGSVVEGTPEEIARFLEVKERKTPLVSSVWVGPIKRNKAKTEARVKRKITDDRFHARWKKGEKSVVKKLYKQGYSVKEISSKIGNGRTPSGVWNIIQKMGLLKKRRFSKPKFVPDGCIPEGGEAPPLLLVPAEFPEFVTVPKEFQQIMRDIVNNVIRNEESMNFMTDGVSFGIPGVKAWNEFCQEFIEKSWQVSSHFNVKDKWRFENHELVYGGA